MRTIFTFFILSLFTFGSFAQDVAEIIRKADQKFKNESSRGQTTMIIERPNWNREISMKTWSLGNDYSMIYITAPAKEKGQVFLKRENEMWNWVPTIERM